MTFKNLFRQSALALLLAFVSTSVMAQEKKSTKEIDWFQELKSRITLNGYAQAGYSYTDQEEAMRGGAPKSSYNLKRTLLWAKARITDRWFFLFMHDFNSVVQEFYTDYRVTKGKELTVILELKVIADVGLVGFPNVGKSTFLSRVSNARPKIADYHFTTLNPNLGVVALEGTDGFVIADIPVLIEGASEGVGLGHEFLKHVERCKVILHIVDAASIEEASVNFQASQWRDQLKAYCTDIVDFQTEKRYDLIVSNPPFFNHFSKCDSERKSRARHNDVTLSYEKLCVVASRLLKPDGRFALVLPDSVLAEFLKVAGGYGLFLHKRLNIIPIEGKEPNRVNLELHYGKGVETPEESFTIRGVDNRFTTQYTDFLKDYYLG